MQAANLSLGPMGAVRPLSPRPHSAMTHFHSFFGSLLVRRAAWLRSSVPRDLEVPHPGPPESVTSSGQGEGNSKGLIRSGPVPLGWGSLFRSGEGLTLDPTRKMDLEVSLASPLQPRRSEGLGGGCGKTPHHIYVLQNPSPMVL